MKTDIQNHAEWFFFVNISKESLDWLTVKPARKYDVN